jgi:hypothetical protein
VIASTKHGMSFRGSSVNDTLAWHWTHDEWIVAVLLCTRVDPSMLHPAKAATLFPGSHCISMRQRKNHSKAIEYLVTFILSLV